MNFKNFSPLFIVLILTISAINCQFFVDVEHALPRIGKRFDDSSSSAENLPTSNEKQIIDQDLSFFVKRHLALAKMNKLMRNRLSKFNRISKSI